MNTRTASASEAKSKAIGTWMAASRQKGGIGYWILACGATHHMSSQLEASPNFKTQTATISIPNGRTIKAIGIGKIWITISNSKGDGTPICLQEVLYILELGTNNLVFVR